MKLFLSEGHNTSDPGAPAPFIEKSSEFKQVKEITYAVYDILKDHGIEVDLVPSDLNLSKSIEYVNDKGTSQDMAIEIHCNSAASSQANGTEIFYYAAAGTERMQQANAFLQTFLKDIPYFRNRGVKTANFSWLKYIKGPSVLFEICFLSNKEDSDELVIYKDEIIHAIAKSCLALIGRDPEELNLSDPREEDIKAAYEVMLNSMDNFFNFCKEKKINPKKVTEYAKNL